MMQKITPKCLLLVVAFVVQQGFAQDTLSQWNFNSPTDDGQTNTGTFNPAAGNGSLSVLVATPSFASGASNGGSSDPATSDDSGLGLTSFPAQGTGDKTTGIQFNVSTAGHENIIITFDLRHSNTSSANCLLQYTLDAGAATPLWVDFGTATGTAGDTWFARSFDLSAVTGLNNNANAAFRVVAAFSNGSTYAAASPTGTYAAGGTWRFDMLTVKGTTITASALPHLVITEIAHSPNNMEFIEVYNAGTTDAELTGLYWTNGTDGNFPAEVLPAGATILFATNTSGAASLMGGTYHLIGSGLGASSDILVIKNAAGTTIDSVNYFVGTNSWPAAPTNAPYGYSFELNSAAADNALGSNWSLSTHIISSASGTIYATPGQYPPPAPDPAPVVSGFTQTGATSTTVTFNQAVTMASAQSIANYVFDPVVTVSAATLSGNTVTLTHDALQDGQPYELAVNNVQNNAAISNIPDTLNLIWNGSQPSLVITEVVHSPNTIEYVEVYNSGIAAVPLGGLKWTNGTTGYFPVMTLAAGNTAVFSTAPATLTGELGVTPVYLLNNGLSSSDDILVIRNSEDEVVDSVAYFVGTNGWPVAPGGVYAYSFELNDAANDNSLGANWMVPLNTVAPQPAGGVVRATPGVYPAPVVTPGSGVLSFTGVQTHIAEDAGTVNIVANLSGGGPDPSSVEIEILPVGTATYGADYTAPVTMQLSWPSNANNVNDTITFDITDDADAEAAEYFIVRFTNPVNVALPAAAGNNFTVYIQDNDYTAPVAGNTDFLTPVASFSNGVAGTNSAEIAAYDSLSQNLYIANSIGAKMDIVDLSDPANPVLLNSINMLPAYGNINSVAAYNGIIAAAIENNNPQANGKVVFFDTNGVYINEVTVGAMPDMIAFSKDGSKILVANEGEPNADYTNDPEGSVSIITIPSPEPESAGANYVDNEDAFNTVSAFETTITDISTITNANVTSVSFASFNSQEAALKASGVRIFGPGATVARDLEPEYITISDDQQTAWVTLQENNAVAKIDIASATVTDIFPLGTKDHSQPGNTLDANDQSSIIQMANWPLKGVYMPDAIAHYSVNGQEYLVTANEGDAREYDTYAEVVRISDASYVLDPATFPDAAALKNNIGRLNATTASGDTDGDGDFDEIHIFGGRSFSIRNATTGQLVWDSGDQFENIIAHHPQYGSIFNASNANNTFKNRSDDKGPEPEGVAVAHIDGADYAFIALERVGGVMAFDISDPQNPAFVDYKNTRDVTTYGGDNGAEGIIYISPTASADGDAYLVLANEVSSTLSLYRVAASSPLPIDLTAFNAVAEDTRNRIYWQSTQEAAGDQYELQHSTNGAQFEKMEVIDARGTPSAYVTYDHLPADGWNYYRLKLKHHTGNITYSKVAGVYRGKSHQPALTVIPNPVTDQASILIADELSGARLSVLDVAGNIVWQVQPQSNITTVNMSTFAAGTYFVIYERDHSRYSYKFQKQ